MRCVLRAPRALVAVGLLAAAAAFAAEPAAPDPVAELQAAYEQAVVAGPQAQLHRELIATVLQRVQRSHATQVDLSVLAGAARQALPAQPGEPAAVFRQAVNAALRTLDPQSRYIDPATYVRERGESSGSFVGLGIEVESAAGAVRVVAPIPGSPAARAGLASGDLILRIDDTPLQGLPLPEALARLRGEPGTPVSITYHRPGTAQDLTVQITRETIRRQLLRASREGDVLVLKLSSFSGPASASIRTAIEEAQALRPLAGLVLDLRGNPGGLLREGIQVADAFLTQGDIVSTRGNTPERFRLWQADAEELAAGVPLVVLVDARSASASELVADALQAHGRATVLGRRSYGKGSVQATFGLGEDKGALKLTTSIYHGPAGQTVHRIGVTPDIELVGGTPKADTETDVAPTRSPQARIDGAACKPRKADDPALSCALAFLDAGSTPAFLAALAPAPTRTAEGAPRASAD